MPQRETKKALVVVRTYPLPSTSGVEVSCTAAITEDGKWLRLYPVPYRFLEDDRRFKKYQWIELEVSKGSDSRPESYHPHINSISVLTDPLPTANDWKARKAIIYPLKARSLCFLQRMRDASGYPTLGFFRPKSIERFRMTSTSATWTQGQLDMLRQTNLFQVQPQAELEKIPHDFFYHFHCDESDCRGHTLHCTDWEIGQSWRAWTRKYGDDWEAKFRQKFETEMIERTDTHFFVGTVQRHPNRWIIIGLFYPPKERALPLFASTINEEG